MTTEVITRSVYNSRVVHFDVSGLGVIENWSGQKFEPFEGKAYMNYDTADKRTFARVTVSGWIIKKDGNLGIKRIGMTWDDGEEAMPPEIQSVLDEHRLG